MPGPPRERSGVELAIWAFVIIEGVGIAIALSLR